MVKEYLNIVIVGHVDHGKSTLIGRLLYDTDSLPPDKVGEVRRTCKALGRGMEFGFILDHLQEEREQGITIDTTQIFFNTEKRGYVIIDAPGHVEFIRNMITGASQAEAAILIVDVKEGVREQTKRHAYLLGMLGLKQLVVVLNKMDLVGYSVERFNEVRDELMKFLNNVNLKPSYVIPIVARDGDNIVKGSGKMRWYNKETVLECLDTFHPTKESVDKCLRLPIQDVYKIGDKRIFVGRVESGVIKEGDDIILLPGNMKTKVASIEKFLEDPTRAEAGESIGVMTQDPLFIERGNVVSRETDLPEVTDKLKANVFWMSKEDVSVDEPLILKLATQEVSAKIEGIEMRIDSSTLKVIEENALTLGNNEVGIVSIKTLNPIIVDNFNHVPELGRFVFERNNVISAGGIITGIEADRV